MILSRFSYLLTCVYFKLLSTLRWLFYHANQSTDMHSVRNSVLQEDEISSKRSILNLPLLHPSSTSTLWPVTEGLSVCAVSYRSVIKEALKYCCTVCVGGFSYSSRDDAEWVLVPLPSAALRSVADWPHSWVPWSRGLFPTSGVEWCVIHTVMAQLWALQSVQKAWLGSIEYIIFFTSQLVIFPAVVIQT